MRLSANVPGPLRLVLVILVAIALSTWIDPYLGAGSALNAQLLNAAAPVVVVLAIWALTGRAWVALIVELLLLGVLRYANLQKVMYLNTDVVYADLTVLGGLLTDPHLVLGFLHPTGKKITGLVLFLVVVGLVGWFTRHRRKAGWKLRIVCAVLAIGGVATIALWRAPDIVHSLNWQVYSQPHGAAQVGIAGNILLGRMTARDVDRPANPKLEQAFWSEPLVQATERRIDPAGDGRRPDIVIVQSESLFEPSQLCGFAETPVLTNVAQQQPDLPGNLRVPVFGGRTLQTEFEVLSGAPISFYPGSMFAYYELVHHPFDALPRALHRVGYDTVLVHPNQRGFWRRDIAMPDMGFGTFQDIGSFLSRDITERGFVSDLAMTRAILAELDSSNRPTFAMGISINNHGPWGKYAPRNDIGLGLPDQLVGKARAEMADYVEHAIQADDAYGYLLNALKRRGRPTVVLFYGDHLPALPKVYDQLCFKDGKPPEAHHPPYRIWANFPIPAPPAETSAYLLEGWLMRAAGLPLKGQDLANAVAGVIAADPTVSAADRKRILAEYANIAAANVARRMPPERGVGRVFVSSAQARGMLAGMSAAKEPVATTANGDLQLRAGRDGDAIAAYDVDGKVSSLSLRPYVTRLSCAGADLQSKIWFNADGDGRTLYRGWLTYRTLRLATLDLDGVKRVTLRLHVDPGVPADCGVVDVRIAQMLCYAARCGGRGRGTAVTAARPPARVLAFDPMAGDIRALDRLELATGGIKQANLRWMLSRARGSQAGYGQLRPGSGGQLLMAPGEQKGAWIDFGVEGMRHVAITPRIGKLGEHCRSLVAPGRGVGQVKLALLLDGKPIVPAVTVSPDFRKTLALDVTGGRVLRVDVRKAGSVSWCDRFSIGFPQLDGANVPALAQGHAGGVAAPVGVVSANGAQIPASGASTDAANRR